MDGSLYRVVNRFAERTAWRHPPMVAFAKYGIVCFGLIGSEGGDLERA